LIHEVIESLIPVCGTIVVVYMTHFFTGEPDVEIESIINALQKQFTTVKFLKVNWSKSMFSNNPGFWECEMRMYGFANTTSDWILFIDSDEVLRSSKRFLEWFHNKKNEPKSFKLANYWYFMSRRRRAKQIEDSIVLVHRSLLHHHLFRMFGAGRNAFAVFAERNVKDLEGDVMFDHYSWVREPDILLRKVLTWGHRNDRDWLTLVRNALKEDPLTTKDFLHNYEYEIV
jgi:hypothetical protein